MKNLTETLNASINEAKEEAYSVAFLGFTDKEGTPITTYVYVPKEYKKDFEKYLEEEADNTIYNAAGYTNDWELER